MEIGAGVWLIGALVVGLVAGREFGRSPLAWFVLSLALSPVIGVLLFMLPPRRVPCPFCAEPIKPAATVCRFCQRAVSPVQPAGGERARIVRWALVGGILAAIVVGATRCDYRFDWWQNGERPLQVIGCC